MKNRVLILVLFSFVSFTAPIQAQNKTLGVGATTLNQNAALHVESPTNNQGFIMPRLTTAQRTAMSSLLTAADNGLMLYDIDLTTIYIWDGSAWKSTADVAGGAKLNFPYKDSVVTPTGTPDLFALKYNNAENKRVLRIENLNKNNLSSALSVSNTSSGLGGYFQNNNDTTSSSTLYATINSNYSGGGLAPVAIYGESTGTGALAASFRINNPANNHPSLWAESNGSRVAHFRKIGTAPGSAFLIQSDEGGALFADNNGTTGYAAVLQNINAANPASAVFAEAVGTGPSMWVMKSTDAVGGDAFYAQNDLASGMAAKFEITDIENTSPALLSTTAGQGAAIVAENTGNGNGFAGLFTNTGATNNYPALQAETNGGGPGIAVYQNAGTGGGVNVHMQNTSSTVPGILVDQQGLGPALQLNRSNNGLAIDIGNGVVKYSTFTVPASGGGPITITDVAVFYILQDGGTYDFAAGQEGEVRYAYASSQSPTVNSMVMSPGEINQFVYLSGSWRLIN